MHAVMLDLHALVKTQILYFTVRDDFVPRNQAHACSKWPHSKAHNEQTGQLTSCCCDVVPVVMKKTLKISI